MAISLDSYQARHFVGADLGPKILADGTGRYTCKALNIIVAHGLFITHPSDAHLGTRLQR